MSQEEALKLALEAFEVCTAHFARDQQTVQKAVEACKRALEEDALEGVAHRHAGLGAVATAIAIEREACANVCELEGQKWRNKGQTDTRDFTLCALHIRLRGATNDSIN